MCEEFLLHKHKFLPTNTHINYTITICGKYLSDVVLLVGIQEGYLYVNRSTEPMWSVFFISLFKPLRDWETPTEGALFCIVCFVSHKFMVTVSTVVKTIA